MSDIITTLHPENDETINLYPNIKKENIPSAAIDETKLAEDVLEILDGIDTRLTNAIASIQQPKYYSTLPTTDKGLIVYSDGYLYSWDGTQYVTTGILYQATQVDDNLNYNVKYNKYNIGIFEITEQNGYLNGSGWYEGTSSYHSKSTGKIYCKENDIFYYRGYGRYDGKSVLYYNSNNVIIGSETFDSKYGFTKVTIPANTSYAIFSSYSATGYDVEFELQSGLSINKNINTYEHVGFLQAGGSFASYANYHCIATKLIKCSEGDIFYYKGYGMYDGFSYVFFNDSGAVVTNGHINSRKSYTKITIPANVTSAIFSSYNDAGYSIIFDLIKDEPKLHINTLFGKKLCVCGDSFSAIYNLVSDTYATMIANKNYMELKDFGVSDTYAHYGEKGFTNSANSYYYQNIPADADYIIIAYGLNEIGTTVGDSTSSDNTTIWGAYNEALAWLIENRPNAKIGIMCNDAWFTYALRNTLKDIAHYWGVNFLDLKGSDTPLFIGGKYAEDGYSVSAAAISQRNSLYRISSENSHPNVTAHAARSSVIENWLKTM